MSWNLQFPPIPRQAVQLFQNTHQVVSPFLPLSMQPSGPPQSQASLYDSSRQHFRTGALPYAGDPSPQVNTGLYYLAMALQHNLARIERENLEILKLLAKLLASQNPISNDKQPRLDHVG
jgi:hypothetical protein